MRLNKKSLTGIFQHLRGHKLKALNKNSTLTSEDTMLLFNDTIRLYNMLDKMYHYKVIRGKVVRGKVKQSYTSEVLELFICFQYIFCTLMITDDISCFFDYLSIYCSESMSKHVQKCITLI